MPSDHDAPGLRRLKRKGGRIDCYWVADPVLIKQGFPTKTVRLPGNPEDPIDFLEMAAHCRRLHSQMLEWKAGRKPTANREPLGTFGWLCQAFVTDEDSPFHDKRPATRAFYERFANIIRASVGEKLIEEATGKHVRRWHKEWSERLGTRGGYACIQTLRRVVSYGCELRNDEALSFAQVLEHMEFSPPKARKKRPTYEQIVGVRDAARNAGRGSIALAVAIQFDLGLRQKDVIGEWVKSGDGSRDGIMDGAWRWEWGLTWSHIDANWILKKPTSKSNGNVVAEHDLKRYPDLLSELTKVPEDRRVGPIIIDERSLKPWRRHHFSHTFRKIARAAGWPDDVWNMDCRAGAVSEAFEAGADPADVMKTATHTQMSTTMIYNRGAVEQTSRVADLRMARRKKEKGE